MSKSDAFEERLNKFEAVLDSIRCDLATIRQEQSNIRQDQASIRQEQSNIRQKQANIRQEQANIRHEVIELRRKIDIVNRSADYDALVWAPNFVCGVAYDTLHFWLGKQLCSAASLRRRADIMLVHRSHAQMACNLDEVIVRCNGSMDANNWDILYNRILLARALLDNHQILQEKYPTEAWVIWNFEGPF